MAFDIEKADPKLTSWMFNVKPHLKALSQDEIREHCKNNSKPYSVMMAQITGDFNFASVIRSANAFGAEKVFYFGKKRFDRRGTCGTHLYIDVQYLSAQEQIQELKQEYTFIALENINRTHYLSDFTWKTNKKPMIVIGEEGTGIPQEVLELCEAQVEIEQFGSVPSVNAAIAASIAMNDFVTKYKKGFNS